MKLYSALIKKDQNNKIEDVVLLEEGFSFMAFVFSGLWFLFHKMWLHFIVVFAINFTLQRLGKFGLISGFDVMFLEAAFLFVIAYSANHWFGEHLLHKGYKLSGFVLADNKADARIKAVQSLYVDYPELSIGEFSDAIVDPRSYRKHLKTHKNQPYFS